MSLQYTEKKFYKYAVRDEFSSNQTSYFLCSLMKAMGALHPSTEKVTEKRNGLCSTCHISFSSHCSANIYTCYLLIVLSLHHLQQEEFFSDYRVVTNLIQKSLLVKPSFLMITRIPENCDLCSAVP